jgi:CHAD domain-containing protein
VISRSELSLSGPAGARVVALDYLARAHDAGPRVTSTRDRGTLHDFRVSIRRLRSWIRVFDDQLDGSISDKVRRRLKRVASATNPTRDLQVQLEWLRHAAKTGGERRRTGASWLERYLRATTADVHSGLRSAVDRDFSKLYDRLSDRLSTFDDSDEHRNATPLAIAALIGERIDPLVLAIRNSLADVHRVVDERAVHKSRIRVKRLRYLIEPVVGHVDGARELVTELTVLQDALGRVHDAHVMTHVIREALERAAIVRTRRTIASLLGGATVETKDESDVRLLRSLPQAGVSSVARRLRADRDAAFTSARVSYESKQLDQLAGLAAAVAERLRHDFAW